VNCMHEVILIADDKMLPIVLPIINQNVCINAIIPFKHFSDPHIQEKYTVYTYDCLSEVIENTSYDFILLMSGFWDFDEEIIRELRNKGVRKEKIVPLFPLLSEERMNIISILQHYFSQETAYDVFATGMSYAHCGILEQKFQGRLLNFTASSNDLFVDYEMAKLIYKKEQSNFHYALIGLAPYSFHYDLSLSSLGSLSIFYDFICQSMHNYAISQEEITALLNREAVLNIYKNLGIDLQFHKQYMERFMMRQRASFGIKDRIHARSRASQWNGKFYPATLRENKKIFEDYLQLCIQHNCKPIIIAFPFTETYMKYFDQRILAGFYMVINEMAKKYDFLFLDYMNHPDFTDADFHNVDHLNLAGAEKLTDLIRNELHRL